MVPQNTFKIFLLSEPPAEERQYNEVKAAEEAAIAQIRADNPDLTEDELRVKLSKVVLDNERRQIEAGRAALPNHGAFFAPPPPAPHAPPVAAVPAAPPIPPLPIQVRKTVNRGPVTPRQENNSL